MKYLLLLPLLAVGALAQDGVHPQFEMPGSEKGPADGVFSDALVAAGKQQYSILCSGCHGPTGEGGRGPSLIEGQNIRRADEAQLFSMIHDGIPGSDMPPFPLPDEQVWGLVGYLRGLTSPAYFAKLAGDPAHGKQLFTGAGGCVKCHAIRGEGGALGPDLSNIGLTLNLVRLREGIVDPNKRITARFEPIVVELKNGEKIRGVAKTRTNYWLDVLDGQGKLHVIDAADVAQVSFPQKSWMPSDYAEKLGEAGIQDLVAYLSQQSLSPSPTLEKGRGEE